MKTLNLLFLLLCSLCSIAQTVVITEIHHSPQKGANLEFIELYNAADKTIDLSNWQFKKGVHYTFSKGTILAAQQRLLLAKNPKQLCLDYKYKTKDSLSVFGPFEGSLDGNGEQLLLVDALGQTIDQVTYKNKGAWAICAKTKGESLQLINPAFDNQIAAHWAAAKGSPLAKNKKVFSSKSPPIINNIQQHPQTPKTAELVTIKAKVQQATKVELWYQIVRPGQYISLSDSAYSQQWKQLDMLDNGQDSDAIANDYIYTVVMPKQLQEHRQLIRYKIVAKGDTTSISPHPSSPEPNFAYYTYNSLPDYKGYSFEQLPQLPVCQLLAKAEDVQHLVYEYKKRKYKTTGTLVYNGKVYDHIGYRSRGYNNRHSRTKRNLKFNFHAHHNLKVVNDNGEKYETKRNKLVLSGGWLLDKPNTHGLAESVLYRLFTMQKTSASYADYLHLRVVDHQSEADSINGDFWGVYLMLENYDGDFLKTHDLPDANIYSYKPFKVRHQSNKDLAVQQAAYALWDTSYHSSHSANWWKKELDWDNYLGFLIGNELIGNRETGYRKQHWWTEYKHPEKGWQFFPWDVDKTWSSTKGKSTISYSIFTKVFEHAQLEKEYKNQLRSVLDLLFNEEQAYQLIDEEAAPLAKGVGNYCFADLDKLRWGHKYEGGFDSQIDYLKRFVKKRRQYILDNLLDDDIALSPKLSYVGEGDFALDALFFEANNINKQTTVALQWRIAEVDSLAQPKVYEISSIWEHTDSSELANTIKIPNDILKLNRQYRIRVRVQDTSEYYSHWSSPIEFSPTTSNISYGEGLVINELLFGGEDKLEFIELYNNSEEALNLEGFSFQKGVRFQFPKAASIAAKDYLVLTNNAKKFKQKYGFEADGVYEGKLSNKGEELILFNAFGFLINRVAYVPNWINATAQKGLSLELTKSEEDNTIADNWQASSNLWGTPRGINSNVSTLKGINSWYWPLIAVFILSFGVLQGYKPNKKLG